MAMKMGAGRENVVGAAPFLTAAFLGSFLLFFLELIAARLLLPAYGGAAGVWIASSMFFQGVLLAGCLYSRAALEHTAPRRYGYLHFLLLLVPVVVLPIALRADALPDRPLAGLLIALFVSVGLPLFVLSTTSSVLQDWLARTERADQDSAYRLYAASNAGALAALALYPFALEPLLSLRAQAALWTWLYAAYVALHWPCRPRAGVPARAAQGKVAPGDALYWTALTLGTSASTLAVTSLLSLDLASVPLLWVVPLAVYLSTFVLAFARKPWYPERFGARAGASAALVAVAVAGAALAGGSLGGGAWAVGKLATLLVALFAVCLLAHTALARSRPPTALAPSFYAWIAAGGWAGAVLVGVVLPRLARHTAAPELDWALAAAIPLAAVAWRERAGLSAELSRRAPLIARGELRLPLPMAALCALILAVSLGAGLFLAREASFAGARRTDLRNFYGFYTIADSGGRRRFYHGATLHGTQFLPPGDPDVPLLYYHPTAPLGRLFARLGGGFRSIGAVGLGAGAVAAYGRPGQTLDFYELDPDVETIARRDFSYVSRSRARVSVILGDARVSLERRADARYDLLILDAFSGGAVPAHLLTSEAFDVYESRLNPGGVIAAHVTNRFLDLRPVLAAAARGAGLRGAALSSVSSEDDGGRGHLSSWVVLSADRAKIHALTASGWRDLAEFDRGAAPWTDQHASLWDALAR
jgi:hypothetical protein